MLFWCFSSTRSWMISQKTPPNESHMLPPSLSFSLLFPLFSLPLYPSDALLLLLYSPCHLLLFPVIILWICINQPLCMLVRSPGCTALSPTLQFITRVVSFTVKEMCKCIQLGLVRRDECGNLLPSPLNLPPYPLCFFTLILLFLFSASEETNIYRKPPIYKRQG